MGWCLAVLFFIVIEVVDTLSRYLVFLIGPVMTLIRLYCIVRLNESFYTMFEWTFVSFLVVSILFVSSSMRKWGILRIVLVVLPYCCPSCFDITRYNLEKRCNSKLLDYMIRIYKLPSYFIRLLLVFYFAFMIASFSPFKPSPQQPNGQLTRYQPLPHPFQLATISSKSKWNLGSIHLDGSLYSS